MEKEKADEIAFRMAIVILVIDCLMFIWIRPDQTGFYLLIITGILMLILILITGIKISRHKE
jgi:diacylglycerol kinase